MAGDGIAHRRTGTALGQNGPPIKQDGGAGEAAARGKKLAAMVLPFGCGLSGLSRDGHHRTGGDLVVG